MIIERHKVIANVVIDSDDPSECGSGCPFHHAGEMYCSLFGAELLADYDRCDECRENIDADIGGRIYDSTSTIKEVEEELENAVGLILSEGKDNLTVRRIVDHIYDAGRKLGMRLYRVTDDGRITKRGRNESK